MTKILKLFGPPGTGKTHTLLTMMEQELSTGLEPERLAYLSFTVQARREALHRAMAKFNLTKDRLPHFRTLHAICYRELEPSKQAMLLGTKDLIELGHSLGVEFTQQQAAMGVDLPTFAGLEQGDQLLRFDHIRRHLRLGMREAWQRFPEDEGVGYFQAERFCHTYQQWKDDEGRYDFTDLLEQATEPLEVDVVIVDEAQDFSPLQWATLHRLAANAKRLYLAGDDDQAIFTWAGADPTAFLGQRADKVKVLQQSYRVPKAVFVLANELATRLRERQPKKWSPRDHEGQVRLLLDVQQLTIPSEGSVLILYRHHFQAEGVEQLLREQGLPYLRNDKPAAGWEWGQGIVAWEQLRKGKTVPWPQAKHAVNAMSVGHGISEQGVAWSENLGRSYQATLVELRQRGVTADGPWFEALRKIPAGQIQYIRSILRHHGDDGLLKPPRIRCSTIHAAKGAEADHVIVVGDLATRSHLQLEKDPDVERRVFYVGVTRARTTLTLVGNDNPLLAAFFRRRLA
jgi:DNA helicase-2/ATP-dependent DNA helicase PcrA